MRIRATAAILVCGLLGGFAMGPSNAGAFRERFKHAELGSREEWLTKVNPDSGQLEAADLEGACGLAFSSSDGLYVADYYHRSIGLYSSTGMPLGGLSLPGGNEPGSEINTTNAVCGLAVDSGGSLYGNEFHQEVLRLSPGEPALVDPGDATGIAVDAAGDLYVNHRTYVAVYDAPIVPGELPADEIGAGSLDDAYGIAVDSSSGTVYVADAADDTVKGFVPAVSSTAPEVTIAHEFRSLVDAAIAVDPTNGHVLVVDNRKPGFEDPEAVVFEFDASGSFLDRLSSRTVGPPGQQLQGPIFGEPSGIAVDPDTGHLYVTTGNSDESNAVKYGAFEASEPLAPPPGFPPLSGGAAAPAGVASGASGAASPATASPSVVVQRGPVRVSFDGKLTPRRLPRHGTAPVGIAVDARIVGTGEGSPPQLRRIAIAINRNGHFSARGLPVCRLSEIQPSTSRGALAACREALVGEGRFAANVKLPEQTPFPSAGKVLAFNGRLNGRPAILAHIYGTQPAPTSYVLPFALRGAEGAYGTTLEASLPQATGDWGYVTGLEMNLRRRFTWRGRGRSYLRAGCPAPPGFPGAVFPLARTSFAFAGGTTLVSVLNRSCTAIG